MGEEQDAQGREVGTASKTPRAPNPASDSGLIEVEQKNQGSIKDAKLSVTSEEWDMSGVSAMSVVKYLIASIQALAETTGDIPPTPPASRPTTPAASKMANGGLARPAADANCPATPVSPLSPMSSSSTAVTPVAMPSPEAHRDEPLPEVEAGDHARAMAVQQAAIARRFFLKTVPPFGLSEYLLRIHEYCPHSPGVYLVAAAYVHRLCVDEGLVPATGKTVHRLCLAAIRVASKAVEDHKWSQDRVAKVGGVSKRELKSLELNLCFLLDFDLFVREAELKRRVFLLQQAAAQGVNVRRRLSGGFRMHLPHRVKAAVTDAG